MRSDEDLSKALPLGMFFLLQYFIGGKGLGVDLNFMQSNHQSALQYYKP